MAVQFILKIDDPNLPVVMQAFNVAAEADLPQAIVTYLIKKVINTKQFNAQQIITGENEIELDPD